MYNYLSITNIYVPEQVLWVVSLYIKTKIPAAWIASEKMKKYSWSFTECFKATREHSANTTPARIFTFIDCLLTHPKSTLTGEALFLPMLLFRSIQRENERETSTDRYVSEEDNEETWFGKTRRGHARFGVLRGVLFCFYD